MLVHPLSPLILFTAASAAGLVVYTLSAYAASQEFGFVAIYGWHFLLLLWLDADIRRRRRVPCCDFGLFAILLYPLPVLWYCVWSRGWRGLALVAALVALFASPYLAASFVWWILYGQV